MEYCICSIHLEQIFLWILKLTLTLQIDDIERRLTREATWMGFCHNDTQYGNLMLHMASDATLEAQADAEDLLDTRRSLDELPESELRSSSGGLDAALGSSPPRLSLLKPQVKGIPNPYWKYCINLTCFLSTVRRQCLLRISCMVKISYLPNLINCLSIFVIWYCSRNHPMQRSCRRIILSWPRRASIFNLIASRHSFLKTALPKQESRSSHPAEGKGEESKEGSIQPDGPSIASVFENEANERSFLDAMDPRLSVRYIPQKQHFS